LGMKGSKSLPWIYNRRNSFSERTKTDKEGRNNVTFNGLFVG
jgi:hypothetical protein